DVFAGGELGSRNSSPCCRRTFGSTDSRCVPINRNAFPSKFASTETQARGRSNGPAGVTVELRLWYCAHCPLVHSSFFGCISVRPKIATKFCSCTQRKVLVDTIRPGTAGKLFSTP